MTLTILKISIFRPVLIRSFSFFLDITNHFLSHSERKISTSPCLRPSAVRLQKAAKVRRKGTYAGASRSGISLTFGRIQIFRGNCGMGGLKLRNRIFQPTRSAPVQIHFAARQHEPACRVSAPDFLLRLGIRERSPVSCNAYINCKFSAPQRKFSAPIARDAPARSLVYLSRRRDGIFPHEHPSLSPDLLHPYIYLLLAFSGL